MSDLFGKAKDVLNSDMGEEMSDKGLDAGADFAKQHAGDHGDMVDKALTGADEHVGDE